MSGSTLYPTALDDASTLPEDKTDGTLTATDHAAHHNNLATALRAVEAALGTTPYGANYATVAAAIAGKVDFSPTAEQIILGTGDIVGLTVKATVAQSLKNVFQMRLNNNAIGAYIDKDGNFSAQALKVAGAALAASHLSNGVSGTGAVVLSSALTSALVPYAPLASPTFTGTPAAPTAAPGTNTTQVASTAFVTAAVGAVATQAGTSGLLSAIPSAASKPGLFYYATDQAVLYFSDGSSWSRMSIPAGTLIDWMNATVPTGWVAYDGSVLGGSTGIYADLYAHLGNTTTLPDTRGRMTVAKGTHADVLTIGNNDGTAVANRRPKHQHTVYDPGHNHNSNASQIVAAANIAGGTTYGAITPNTSTNTTGVKVNPEGASTSSSPQDAPPYIVTLKIAKL